MDSSSRFTKNPSNKTKRASKSVIENVDGQRNTCKPSASGITSSKQSQKVNRDKSDTISASKKRSHLQSSSNRRKDRKKKKCEREQFRSEVDKLRKYLELAFKNSLDHMHDQIIATLPTEMSLYYQKLHDTLVEIKEDNNQMDESPNKTNSMNEMHEFISASTGEPMSQSAKIEETESSNKQTNFNPYAPPPRQSSLLPNPKEFLQDPVSTSLLTLNRVTNYLRLPATQIVNQSYNIVNTLATPVNINQQNISGSKRPPGMAERVTHDQINNKDTVPLPPPVLPLINCTHQQMRLSPLTAQEFDQNKKFWTVNQLRQRVFRGGISESLRLAVWPFVLGLDEDENNSLDKEFDWSSREKLYEHYSNQWKSILPEQEKRFMLFRERKSLIERDVIRCDRTHPFYQGDKNENLEKLKQLLLTYMMYDFDTGYVQGMSDLASPLLFVAHGDTCKAFWFFVKIMKFTNNNFEMSQLAIKNQLEMLYKLIKITDPIFAQYLDNNESNNCYFSFRWIVCQFKREFMKLNSDDYQEVLILWESIWTCQEMKKYFEKLKHESEKEQTNETNSKNEMDELADDLEDQCKMNNSTESSGQSKRSSVSNEKNVTIHSEAKGRTIKKRLSDTELYVLCICLAIIRRERDLIMANRFDCNEILKHFNNLELTSNLKNILIHAANIWSWLIFDENDKLLFIDECDETENDLDKADDLNTN